MGVVLCFSLHPILQENTDTKLLHFWFTGILAQVDISLVAKSLFLTRSILSLSLLSKNYHKEISGYIAS